MSGACRSCGAPILWALTPKGLRMPLDVEPHPEGNVLLVGDGECRPLTAAEVTSGAHPEQRHRAHFATCPHAAQHRRRRA